MFRKFPVVSTIVILLTVICFPGQGNANGMTDEQALDNVPNVPVKWMDPFATVDVKDQPKLDWGPVPKPGDTGTGTDDSKTDVVHAVEDLLGEMQDVDKNTRDANEGHLIDFWLSGNELPPELMAHLTDKIGNSLSPPGVPDVVGTGLGSGTGDITFVGNTDSQGQGGSGSINQGQHTTASPMPTTIAPTTTTVAATTTSATTKKALKTTISKGPTRPTTQQTTTVATTQAFMTPNPTTAQQILPVQSTTPKLSRKQLQELRRLQRKKQRELKRQKALEARRLAQIKKAEKAEQARIARQKAKEERLARQRAKQEQRILKRKQQQEARRLAREKIKARVLAARKALVELRRKARTDKQAAARLVKLEARFKALRQKLRAKNKQIPIPKPKTKNPNKLSAEEIKRQEELFLQGLMH